MSNTYTEFVDSYIESISEDEPQISTVLNALDQLRTNDDYNLTFSARFSKLISEKGNLPYSPNADERKTFLPLYRKYLYTVYKTNILTYETDNDTEQLKIPDAVRKNIENWLSGKNLPSSNKTRDLLFKICFALNLSFNETEWFFNHLCFQRSFNLHSTNEIVYYYCFNNNLNYEKARILITKLEALKPLEIYDNTVNLFTQQVIDLLSEIHSDDELIEFYKSHYDFVSSDKINLGAIEEYEKLYRKLKPNNSDDLVRKQIKSFIDNRETELHLKIRDCSPFIREQLEKIITKGDSDLIITEAEFKNDKNNYKYVQELYDFFVNQSIFKNSFLLRCIYGSLDIDVEKIPFFPSEKTLSDLSEKKISRTTNYHDLRECLILFYFFDYWLDIPDEIPSYTSYETFKFDLNDILLSCGYETLYSGNAYDRVFLLCSRSEDPITTFRTFLKQYLEKQ